ncbi:unnamed protein product [Discula destructiva]
MDHASDTLDFEGTLTGRKLRDGRHGPIYLGLQLTGNMTEVEVIPRPVPKTLLAQLRNRQSIPADPNLIACLGVHETPTHVYLVTEWLPAEEGRLPDLIRTAGGPLPPPLARAFLRQMLRGLAHLHAHGVVPVFLDSARIAVTGDGTVKIDFPEGNSLPRAAATLPEIVLGQGGDLRAGVDVWLLGMVAAEMLSGDSGISSRGAGDELVSKIKEEGRGSALEQVLPPAMARKLEEAARDFLDQCFTINIDDRPSILELQAHPFLNPPP